MEQVISVNTLKDIVAYAYFLQEGEVISAGDLEIHFIKDGNSTRVDEIKLGRKG